MSAVNFETLADAQTHVMNSGVIEWFSDKELGQLTEYMYYNCDGELTENELVSEFIKTELGGNPSDYDL